MLQSVEQSVFLLQSPSGKHSTAGSLAGANVGAGAAGWVGTGGGACVGTGTGTGIGCILGGVGDDPADSPAVPVMQLTSLYSYGMRSASGYNTTPSPNSAVTSSTSGLMSSVTSTLMMIM